MHPLNQPLVEFVKAENDPVAAFVMTREDLEWCIDRELTDAEHAVLCRQIEKSEWVMQAIWETVEDLGRCKA